MCLSKISTLSMEQELLSLSSSSTSIIANHVQANQIKPIMFVYRKLAFLLIIIFAIFLVICVIFERFCTFHVCLATSTTLLLWFLVTWASLKTTFDLTTPMFVVFFLGPTIVFITYLSGWMCICKYMGHATEDLLFHALVIFGLEIIFTLAFLALLIQWLSNRSQHLYHCPYTSIFLVGCLVLLYALVLSFIVFICSVKFKA